MTTRLVYVLVIAAVVVADHATKWAASVRLSGRQPVTALDGAIVLLYSKNPGAFLSLGATLDPQLRFWLFTVGVGVVLLAIAAYLFRRSPLSEGLFLSLILGGGFSNWIDRIVNHGLVVDFINLGIGPVRTGIFNLADFVLSAAIVALVGKEMTSRRAGPRRERG